MGRRRRQSRALEVRGSSQKEFRGQADGRGHGVRREQEVAPTPGLGPSGLGILGRDRARPFRGNCQHRGPQLTPTERKNERDKGGAHTARDSRRSPGLALAPRRKGPPAHSETSPALRPGPGSSSPRPSEPLLPPHLPTGVGGSLWRRSGEGPGGACRRLPGGVRVSASRIPSARSWGSRPTSGERWRKARARPGAGAAKTTGRRYRLSGKVSICS